MNSMSSVIKQQYYKVLSTTKNEDRLCICRNKDHRPFDGKRLHTCIVYHTDVITKKDSHIYCGARDGEFLYISKFLNLCTITKQLHIAINIMSKTQNFLNTSGNYKTKASSSP